jgi:hypothetical protein
VDFRRIFHVNEISIFGAKMTVEHMVVDLLADKTPAKARDLMLGWAQRRNASWADAAREAESRAASGGHLPQIRGQLRFHLGEAALGEAARSAGAGVIPFRTTPPGGIFMVARVGRFALVNLSVRYPGVMPRRSLTRKMLSQANDAIDPQRRLDLGDEKRVVTELAYFGCLAAVPSGADPTAPAVLALGVPNAGLTNWLAWIPSHRLHAYLQERTDGSGKGADGERSSGSIPDNAFPKFRLPKKDESQNDGEP